MNIRRRTQLIVLGLVAAILIILFVATRNNKDNATPIRDEFSDSNCARACWLGIEPGVTTQEALIGILAKLGVNYVAFCFPPGSDESCVYEGVFETPPFLSVAPLINIGEGVVGRIYFLTNHICLSQIVSEYGPPAHIGLTPDYDPDYFFLPYPELGLVFESSLTDRDYVSISLVSEEAYPVFFAESADRTLRDWEDVADIYLTECNSSESQ